jgi:PiT family inorganic phosphate transporter
MLQDLKRKTKAGVGVISKAERKTLNRVYRADLVKRSVVTRVIAAWIITVPASAGMAAVIFFAIRGAMLG